jgi:hypothetical protein
MTSGRKFKRGKRTRGHADSMVELIVRYLENKNRAPKVREAMREMGGARGFNSTSAISSYWDILARWGLVEPQATRDRVVLGTHMAVPRNYLRGDIWGSEIRYDNVLIDATTCNPLDVGAIKQAVQVDTEAGGYYRDVRPDSEAEDRRGLVRYLLNRLQDGEKVAVVTENKHLALAAIALDVDVYHPAPLATGQPEVVVQR